MSHEIEANFVQDYSDEARQCQRCTSFIVEGESCFCVEAKTAVPPTAHCDFFQALD